MWWKLLYFIGNTINSAASYNTFKLYSFIILLQKFAKISLNAVHLEYMYAFLVTWIYLDLETTFEGHDTSFIDIVLDI